MSKVALIILDGYGIGNQDENNAIWMAKTPVMDKLMAECTNTMLSASGLDVGLQDGRGVFRLARGGEKRAHGKE